MTQRGRHFSRDRLPKVAAHHLRSRWQRMNQEESHE